MVSIVEKETGVKNDTYNPWPGFKYTGKLRVYPVVSYLNIWQVKSKSCGKLFKYTGKLRVLNLPVYLNLPQDKLLTCQHF
jgi:hypothetical protein